jgi:hypothetical protein
MRSLRNITIGVRSQAMTVILLIGLWYASLAYGLGHMKEQGSDFWGAVTLFAIPISVVFTIILWHSYLRSGGAHGPWVTVATWFALSPLFLLLMAYLASAL